MRPEVRTMYLSPIREMTMRAAALSESGADVISFGAGDSAFGTPAPVREAAIRAIRAGRSHYESIKGNKKLRTLLAEEWKRDQDVDYGPDDILITAAGTEGIFDAMTALLSPGDEVIVFSPAFINYDNCIRLAGARVIFVELREENGFIPDPDEVRRKITPKTKMIVLNNPCNPTGAVYPEECLRKLAKIAEEYNLIVFSDEVYDRIIYQDKFCAMASIPGMRDRTVTINSFSKRLAMTGWRIGWITATGNIMEAIYKVHHYSTACQPTFIQDALADTIEDPEVQRIQREMVVEFRKRRNIMMDWIRSHPCFHTAEPHGAFYCFINEEATGMDGRSFAGELLEKKHVTVIPGAGFGDAYSGYIRMSYGVTENRLYEGLDRIDQFLEEKL